MKMVIRRGSSRRQRVFHCQFCLYESLRNFNVLRHEQRIHRNKHWYKCCGQTMKTKGQWYAHRLECHPIRPGTYVWMDKYKLDKTITSRRRSSVRRSAKNLRKTTKKTTDNHKTIAMKFEDIPLIELIENPELYGKYAPKNPSARVRQSNGESFDSCSCNSSTNSTCLTPPASSLSDKSVAEVEENLNSIATNISDCSLDTPKSFAAVETKVETSPLIESKLPLKKRIALKMKNENIYGNNLQKDFKAIASYKDKENQCFPINDSDNEFKTLGLNFSIDFLSQSHEATERQRDFLSFIDFETFQRY